MTNEDSSLSSTNEFVSIESSKVGRMIAGIARVGDLRCGMGECRTEVIALLIELTEAASGLWAWGISNDSASAIAPVATVEVGLSATESAAIVTMGLDPLMNDEFRFPIMKRMDGRTRSTDLRTDLYDDQDWKAKRMRANLSAGGFDEWLHSVRYDRSETWSSLFLVRHAGSPPFQSADRELIDLAMGSIPWLGATLDISLPARSSVELTPRQRVVLLMQLGGLARKEIAARLEISVDTVGDHMKQIYEHFNVSSAGELAAIFLRDR